MTTSNITIELPPDLQRRISTKSSYDSDRIYSEAMRHATNTCYTIMKKRSRVKTGLLKTMWHMEFTKNGLQSNGIVSNPMDYAQYMENGFTHRKSGRKFKGDHIIPIATEAATEEYHKLVVKAIKMHGLGKV
jgi:hypothetical protein